MLSTAERRWLAALLAAMIPRAELEEAQPRGGRLTGPAPLPGLAELGADRHLDELLRAAPPMLALGLRVATWTLTFGPAFFIGRLARFEALDADARDLVLCRASHSRLWLVRQLVLVLQLAACFVYFAAPAARERFPGARHVPPDGRVGGEGA